MEGARQCVPPTNPKLKARSPASNPSVGPPKQTTTNRPTNSQSLIIQAHNRQDRYEQPITTTQHPIPWAASSSHVHAHAYSPHPIQYTRLGNHYSLTMAPCTRAGQCVAPHWSRQPSNNRPPHAHDSVRCGALHEGPTSQHTTHSTQHQANEGSAPGGRCSMQLAAPRGIRRCTRTVSCTLQRSTPDADNPDASASSTPLALSTQHQCHGRRPALRPAACSPRCRDEQQDQ